MPGCGSASLCAHIPFCGVYMGPFREFCWFGIMPRVPRVPKGGGVAVCVSCERQRLFFFYRGARDPCK